MKLLLSFLLLSVTSSVILHLASRPRPLHLVRFLLCFRHFNGRAQGGSARFLLEDNKSQGSDSIMQAFNKELEEAVKTLGQRGTPYMVTCKSGTVYTVAVLSKLQNRWPPANETGIHGRIFFIRVEGRYLQPFHSGIDYSVKASQKFADSITCYLHQDRNTKVSASVSLLTVNVWS
ncbi:hypothetical protein SDJN02_21508, partial [Cucurbita argyrosperma subsp. argyrosperma]